MPLLGAAAMLLSFDVLPEMLAEHDDWHTHEHLPERLCIPGFLRGTRWVALHGQPRYLVLYEVAQLETLGSEAYLESLNHPSPWTARMMPGYRGMSRGLCAVAGSFGLGTGHLVLVLRFSPDPALSAGLRVGLLQQVLPALPDRRGIGGAHLVQAAMPPAMTNEQRIRGADAGVDWALLVTGYDQSELMGLLRADLSASTLAQQGAGTVTAALYRMDYALSRTEIDAGP